MPRAKGQHDIAPIIRRAFIGAVTRIGNGDSESGLRDIIEEELKNNPIATLNVLSRFMPREHNVQGSVEHEHSHSHTHESVSETSEWIAGLIGDTKKKPSKKSVSH